MNSMSWSIKIEAMWTDRVAKVLIHKVFVCFDCAHSTKQIKPIRLKPTKMRRRSCRTYKRRSTLMHIQEQWNPLPNHC